MSRLIMNARLDRGASGAGPATPRSFNPEPRTIRHDEARHLMTLVDFDSLNGSSMESIGEFRRGCHAILHPRSHTIPFHSTRRG
jgi:hypothetical protein